jgi:hypothetical protein
MKLTNPETVNKLEEEWDRAQNSPDQLSKLQTELGKLRLLLYKPKEQGENTRD